MHFVRRTLGDDCEIYERELGVTPEQVRDQEERVHELAGNLAFQASYDGKTTDPQIEGDTVSLHRHNAEDADQDKVHNKAARLAYWRSQSGH